MGRRRHDKPALLVQVLAELGAGRIREDYIVDTETPPCFIHGETVGRSITINPAPAVVDTILHECLHRLYPAWSEHYVRNRTSFLMKRLSDEQIQAVFAIYEQVVKKHKRRQRRARSNVSAVLPTGAGASRRQGEGEEV